MSRATAGLALAIGAADVVLAATGPRWARWVTKPALVPAVALAVRATGRRPTPALGAALAGSWAGDVALLTGSEAGFLGGVGSFAAAHAAYLSAIRAVPARPTAEPGAVVDLVFGAVAVGAGAVLWRRLDTPKDRALRLPVLGYTALVTGMGAAAVRAGLRQGGPAGRALAAGGALFVVSDGLVAVEHFGGRPRPAVSAAVMATYGTAQALLAAALSRPAPR